MEDASGLDEISLDALSEGFQGFEPAYRARAISIFNRHISQLRQIAQTHGVLQPLNRVLNSQLNEAIRVNDDQPFVFNGRSDENAPVGINSDGNTKDGTQKSQATSPDGKSGKAKTEDEHSASPLPQDEEGRTCAVCFEEIVFDFTGTKSEKKPNLSREIMVLRCGHEFHASCIIPWIFSEPPIEANHPVATQLCPLCRFPLSLDISESMEECRKLLRDASLPFYRVSTPAVSTERRIETIASSRRTSHIRHILGFPLPVAEPVRSGGGHPRATPPMTNRTSESTFPPVTSRREYYPVEALRSRDESSSGRESPGRRVSVGSESDTVSHFLSSRLRHVGVTQSRLPGSSVRRSNSLGRPPWRF